MTFEDADKISGIIAEAKHVTPLDYSRHWVEFKPSQRRRSKNGNLLYGFWQYNHRQNAGATYNDGTVVHHHNHNKHDNSKGNLTKMSRARHDIVDPNARKYFKCKICGGKHYAHHLCQKHYRQWLRKHKSRT